MTQASPTLETALMVIDGEDVAARGGDWLETRDPATGRVLARVPRAGPRTSTPRCARRAEPSPRGERSLPANAALLLALAGRVAAQAEELTRLETLDVGKPLHEARVDVHHAERLFRFYGEAVDKVHTEKLTVDGGFAFTDRIPHGVTGHITPWNYPIQLFARTVAPALAVGNACVVKPAEDTPLTSLRVACLALEAGLPAGVLNVVTGLGAEAGSALADHPDVDHLSFTGSRPTGERVMAASARQMRPVMLELGGKSPSILLGDVDVADLVPTLRSAVLWNGGQTCDAQSRILVDRAIHADVLDALTADFAQVTIGPGVEDHDLGPLVSETQHRRVSAHVGAARTAGGARLVIGGRRPDGFDDGWFFEPTIFDVSDPSSPIANEEVFGPVLTIVPFRDEREAVRLANGVGYDLAAAVWTKDIDRAFRLASQIRAGQVHINSWGIGSGVELSFGGIRQSGFGREKGLRALDEYSALRTTTVRVDAGPSGR
jgi:aldehyde dehydrogenase (NAD+)/betaine-aldehyde dehydrogenase